MKTFKRAISVFLAMLMILSSMSAFAVLNDGGSRTITSQVRFYRYDETAGDYVETIKVAPGDQIEVRIILQSDFIVGTNFLYYLYNKDVFEIDSDDPTATSCDIVSYDTTQRNGTFYYGSILSSINNDLIDKNYLDSSVFNDYDACYFYADGGVSSAFDGTTEVYTAHFKVKDDAAIGSVGSLFIPTETAQNNRDIDNNFISQPTYAARLTNVDEAGIDVGKVETETSEAWDPELEVINLASTNISTIAAAQGIPAADVATKTVSEYNNGATVSSSFVVVTENINVTYYILNEENTYLTDENDDPVLVTWQTSDSYQSGKSSGKTYYYNFTSYQEQATTCLDGLTPSTPTVRGNLQNIPEGYYFAGWMPVSWDDGVDVTREDALSYMTSPASISDTVEGTVYNWPTATSLSEKNASKTYKSSYIGLVADPNAATMKALTTANYGDYIYTGDDGGKYLDLIAVVLPIPQDVTVSDVEVPGSATVTGSTFQAPYGSDIEEADVLGALSDELPEVDGYTLKYYATVGDEDPFEIEDFADNGYTVTSAVTISPVYEKNEYTITYMYGGEEIESFDVLFGDDIEITTEEPVKPGYEFDTWVDEDGNEPEDYDSMPAKNLEFQAQFNPVDQTVTYYLDNVATGETSTAKTDATFTLNDLPVKAGYEVTGWILKDAEGNDYTGTTMPVGGLNAYATSTAQPQAITYKVDGVVKSLTPAAANTDVTITLADKPVKAGYTYSDWTLEDGSAIPATMPAGGITVVSNGTADAQPITYKVDGVVTALTPATANTDAAIVLADKPVKAGYSYTDWTLEDDSAIPETMPAGGIVVVSTSTALPQPITYKVDGVVVALTPNTADTDAAIVLADKPVKAGYSYTDWTLENGSAVPATMPAGGITVVSTSTALPQTITYKVDGVVTNLTPATANTDAAIVLAAKPVKAGYTYTDWTLEDGSAVPATMPAGGITVVSNGTALEQTIIYKVDGVVTTLAPASANTDEAVVLADKPVKAGYSYTDWTLENGSAVPATMPAGGITVVTYSTALEQTISYYVDGALAKEETYATDADVTAYNPTKAGYTFSGWYSDADCSISATVPATMPATNVVLYGKFTADAQPITYKVDGETVALTPATADTDAAIVLAAKPSKAGYTYTDWTLEDGSAIPETMPVGGIVVVSTSTADAQPITYKVDGVVTELTPATADTDAAIVLAAKPVKAGYTYTDWTLEDGSAIPEAMPAGGITVVSTSTADAQNIIYKVDGVVVALTPNTADTDAAFTLADKPSKDGYSYTDWTLEDGSAVPATMPAGGITVVSTSTALPQTINYVVDGAAYDSATFNTDATILRIADPSRDGYTFHGWYADENYENAYTFGTMPAGGVTVYGYFTADPQSIIYVVDRVVVTDLAPATADTDAAVVLAALPEKAGYSYSAWTLENGDPVPATMPAGGITVVTNSTALDQPITYKVDGEIVALTPASAKTDATFTLADKPSKDGYSYTAWAMEDGSAIPETMPAGGIVVVSTSTALPQALEYYVDGVKDEALSTTVNTDAAYTLEAIPTKDGYSYTAWKLEDGTDAEVTGTMPYGGIKVYTTSTALPQALEYYVDGVKDEALSTTVDTDTAYTLEAIPEKAGYSYTAWMLEDGTYAATAGTMPAGGIKVYTTSTALPQDLEYYVNGELVKVDKINTDAAYTLEAIPEKAGYTYTAWKLADGTDAATTGTMPAGGIKVYTTSTADDQTITYKVDGEVVALTPDKAATNAEVVLADKPSKDGYTYTDWTLEDGSSVPGRMPVGGIVVVSNGTADDQTIKYVVDGEEYSIDTIKTDAAINLIEKPTEEGYTYSDWALEDGSAVPTTMPAGGVTVYSNKTANQYRVILIDKEGTEIYNELLDYGTAITFPSAAEMKVEGYNFLGWNADDDSFVAAAATSGVTVPAKNITYTADYNRTEYKVTIKLENLDGTYAESSETRYAATGDAVAATDADKTAEGYYVSDDSVLTATVSADGSTEIVVVLNLNSYKLYTVVGYGNETEVAELKYGEAIPAIAAATETGKTFHGWYAESTYENEFAIAVMPAADVMAYGYFTDNDYTITYISEGEEFSAIEGLHYGDAIELPESDPEKTGYYFAGWYDADGKTPADYDSMPADDITFTAKFVIATYSITYYVDGNMVAKFSQDYDSAINYNVYKAEAGMKLDGWYNDAACTEETTLTTMPANNVKVYAKTVVDDTVTKTVTFKDADGNTIGTQEVVVGTVLVPETAVPEKDGYKNGKWSIDGENPINEITMPDEDITLVPVYDNEGYTVTYVYGDTTVESFSVAFGDEIDVTTTEPEKAGYEFTGWLDADDKAPEDYASMPAKNLTFTAQFKAVPQTITYKIVTGDVSVEVTDITPNTADTDATITLAAKPADDDAYSYSEWAMEDGSAIPETMPAGGITVVSTATALPQTITYKVDGVVVALTPANANTAAAIVLADKPSKPGYSYSEWAMEDGSAIPETMPAGGITVVSTSTALPQPITYKVDGEVVELEPATAYTGEAITLALVPSAEGFEYSAWAMEDGSAIPETMPAGGIIVVSNSTALTVTYTFDADGGVWSDGTTDAKTITVAYGGKLADAIEALADEPTKTGYTFIEWTAEGTTATAQWKQIVKLVPVENSTAMVERDTVVETYNTFADGDRTPYGVTDIIAPNPEAYEADGYDTWYVYGLATNLKVAALADYVQVTGDGSYKVYNAAGEEVDGSSSLGTGLVIKVFDNETGNVVEEFYVIIFGDIDGNGIINGNDSGQLRSEVISREWSKGDNIKNYLVKAADLDLNGVINGNDGGVLKTVTLKTAVVDQTIGGSK